MGFFWIFLIGMLLILLVVLARNQGRMPWAWNFLIIAVILFTALFKMTGTPRDAWLFATIERVHGDMEVITQVVIPHKFVYLLLRNTPGAEPYYLRLPWSEGIEQQLDAALMQAKEQQTALLVDIDKLSGWSVNSQADSFAGKGKAGKQNDGKGQGEGEGNGKASGVKDGKEGGESMFYPRPVQPDPLKPRVHAPIEIH